MADIVPFIEMIIERCDVRNVGVTLQPTDEVMCDGEGVCGYFDDMSGNIVVAGNSQDWWMTLAHEFGHMTRKGDPSKGARELFDGWLRGERRTSDRVLRATRAIQEDEMHAERFAVSLARKFRVLPPGYVQRANAYILSFEVARRWRKDLRTRPGDALCASMPKRLISDFGTLSEEIETMYIEDCYG